ncbi:hypothetical protein [Sphingomonas sp.]|uniref:WD40 repeat domain-containing protein n=1 Tax=Sphingomonas sp. TaxID=28214 RepID=UPI001B263ECE|nr:hypothetical protein [Sphingomonas sp.]MBO9712589.1 hypothetical protein [Sphingomonas sp.]
MRPLQFLIAAALLAAAAPAAPIAPAPGGGVLHPAGRIGFGWADDLWKQSKFGWMSFVAFDPSGRQIASDGATDPTDVDGTLSLWSFPAGKLIRKLPGRPIAIAPDWRYYATTEGIRQMRDGTIVAPTTGTVHAAFVPHRESAVVASWGDGPDPLMPRLVDLTTGRTVRGFGSHRAFALAVSPDGSLLAAGYWDSIALWDLRTGHLLATLRGMGRYVRSLAFSPDGRVLAAGSDLATLQLWDVHRRTLRRQIELEGAQISTPAFSPDGRRVAAGTYGNGTAWLVDTRSGKVLGRAHVSGMGCGSVAFSPDGRHLITPSTGGLVTWPYDRGGTVRVFRVSPPPPTKG